MVSSYPQLKSIASKYSTNNIFIVGKGPSVDEIDVAACDEGLVINLNDSEQIIPGDIGIFHAQWVIDSLRSTGFSCQLYITQRRMPQEVPILHCPYVGQQQELNDLIVQRFFADTLTVEGILFVSALKVARIVAHLRMRRQNVYALGFDFSAARGLSKKITKDFSPAPAEYRDPFISAQEHHFLKFAYLLRESNLLINHVGSQSYSSLSCDDFNRRFAKQVGHPRKRKSGPIARGPGRKRATDSNAVLVVAELTTNHFGDLERLEKMVRNAKQCGADFIKVQKRDVDTFYTAEQLGSVMATPFGKTFGDYRRQLELDEEAFSFLDNLCQKVGIRWFASILDRPSFEFIQQFRPQIIKLPSTISQHRALLDHVANNFEGDLVVSTGFSEKAYEDFVLGHLCENRRLFLMQCTSAYPTEHQDCNVAVVQHYAQLARSSGKDIVPGYSSHDYGSIASMLAVACGARMVEKHVKLGNTDWAHFDSVALDLATDAFADYVKDIRLAQLILGEPDKRILDAEQHKYWKSPGEEDKRTQPVERALVDPDELARQLGDRVANRPAAADTAVLVVRISNRGTNNGEQVLRRIVDSIGVNLRADDRYARYDDSTIVALICADGEAALNAALRRLEELVGGVVQEEGGRAGCVQIGYRIVDTVSSNTHVHVLKQLIEGALGNGGEG